MERRDLPVIVIEPISVRNPELCKDLALLMRKHGLIVIVNTIIEPEEEYSKVPPYSRVEEEPLEIPGDEQPEQSLEEELAEIPAEKQSEQSLEEAEPEKNFVPREHAIEFGEINGYPPRMIRNALNALGRAQEAGGLPEGIEIYDFTKDEPADMHDMEALKRLMAQSTVRLKPFGMTDGLVRILEKYVASYTAEELKRE